MYQIRIAKNEDMPALKGLWASVFGSEGMDAFFERLFSTELTAVAEVDGKLAAMGYLIPTGSLLCGKELLTCAMLYSIAALPRHRGKGYGTAVIQELARAASKQGYEAIIVKPATDSLFRYYGNIHFDDYTKFQERFYVSEKGINLQVAAKVDVYPLEKVSVREYSEIREQVLIGITHITYSADILKYQQALCEDYGGGLFRIGNSCAVVEVERDGSLSFKELLLNGDDEDSIIYSIMQWYRILKGDVRFPNITVRVPVLAGHKDAARFGMLAVCNSNGGLSYFADNKVAPWYGLALD